uniref:Translation initiation factor IF-3 n=1 Tax=Helicotheca tamesis TaxID=374047 RepID=A0A7S2MWU2_9STRA|mmetsp:Transcript_4846/g.6624  ORF Transcript_4846/g.6624 Transcript_4846/m.6624 type:complete len:345 (+) Transcript_4846:209-1243(+)|eukprot:CAMPEP_0185725596 /NCGR_PEP_ID=MMETSP1171-20130828/1809_1 /TAXON_ID=374046 /ORGANISM="Helicotheca tamensis, Strain CCMP826" /LENGTH=344 /DNA_ID=CAMNT_0028393759 /DNA_START=176 /DNA_END=1210 /DNA_ORIENTATION=-
MANNAQNSRRVTPLSALILASSITVASGFGGMARVGTNYGVASSSFGIPSLGSPLTTIPPSQSSPSTTALSMAQRRGRPRGPVRTIEQKPTMNDEIQYDTMRVTTPSAKGKDEALGIMSRADALAKAKEMGGLDLILINENSDPPVCKIVDYSKYRYMKEKKAKELKKNSKASEVKEVKMSYKIDVHDYGVRKKNASKFINQGNRVKCTVMFKGREVQHDNLGYDLLNKLAEDMQDICTMDGKPKREGRNLSCFVVPKPEILKKINENKRKDERAKRKKREASKAKMEEKLAAKQAAAAAAMGMAVNGEADVSKKTALLEEDDDDDATLDELLGGDSLTDDLFG